MFPWYPAIFLRTSLVFPILLFSSILLCCSLVFSYQYIFWQKRWISRVRDKRQFITHSNSSNQSNTVVSVNPSPNPPRLKWWDLVAAYVHSRQYGRGGILTINLWVLSHVHSWRPHGLKPIRLLSPWDYPDKNIRVSCHFHLQEIILTQGLNLQLLHWVVDSLPLIHGY